MGNYTFLREICLIESFLVKVEKSAIYEYDKYIKLIKKYNLKDKIQIQESTQAE